MTRSKISYTIVLALTITALFPCISHSQSITVSPTSVPLWGKTLSTAKVAVEYKNFELVGTYSFQTFYDMQGHWEYGAKVTEYVGGGKIDGLSVGLFYKPINFTYKSFKFTGGAGIFAKRFPTINGQRVAFTAQMSYEISDHISLRYAHISNGFGIVTKFNPGLDNIGVQFRL